MPNSIRIPLLKDHHSHPLFYSAFAQGVNLQSFSSRESATGILQEVSQLNSHQLTVAHGWRDNHYRWTTEELESLPPVAIFNVSLHSLVINQAGTEILHQRFGDVIENLDDPNWYESNLRVVLNWFANLYASADNLVAFFEQMRKKGVYYIEEMLLVDENELSLFDQTGLRDRTRFWAAPDTFDSMTEASKSLVHGLKLFTDGAIGSRSAAMNRPFLGDAEANFGMLIYSDKELPETISQCLDTGLSLAIHAIGDRAIEQVINSLETLRANIGHVPEIRIEHAQMITSDLARRAKRLGLTLSMQPNFSSDSTDYADRLDARYCDLNNPFRMLIDQCGFVAGQDLIFGSDGMPHGIESAINQALFPSRDSQQLSIDEFVAGYCLNDQSPGAIDLEIDEDLRLVQYNIH